MALQQIQGTLPKTNGYMAIYRYQNDGLEKVTPSKNGNFWYPC